MVFSRTSSPRVISGEIAHENPKGMTLQTPTSVLGIRGTRFVVNVK